MMLARVVVVNSIQEQFGLASLVRHQTEAEGELVSRKFEKYDGMTKMQIKSWSPFNEGDLIRFIHEYEVFVQPSGWVSHLQVIRAEVKRRVLDKDNTRMINNLVGGGCGGVNSAGQPWGQAFLTIKKGMFVTVKNYDNTGKLLRETESFVHFKDFVQDLYDAYIVHANQEAVQVMLNYGAQDQVANPPQVVLLENLIIKTEKFFNEWLVQFYTNDFN